MGSQIALTSEAELKNTNGPVVHSVSFSSVMWDCVFPELQRDILCKPNVFDYLCALDAISSQSYYFSLTFFFFKMFVYKKDKPSG